MVTLPLHQVSANQKAHENKSGIQLWLCLQLHARFSLSLHSDFVRNLQCEVYDMSSTKKRKANTLDQFFQLKQPRVEPPSTQANTADKSEETNAVNKTTSRHRNEFDRS